MKFNKLLYLSVFAFFAFAACEPMADIDEELEKAEMEADALLLANKDKAVAPEMAYKLTEDNYGLSANENVGKYKSFSDSDPVKENLPGIVDQLFVGEPGASVAIEYTFYFSAKEEATGDVYTMLDGDYTSLGKSSAYLSNDDEAEELMARFADLKFYTMPETTRQIMEFTFKGKEDRYGHYTFDGTDWVEDWTAKAGDDVMVATDDAVELEDADLEALPEDADPRKYGSFDADDESATHMSTILKVKYASAVNGDTKLIKFAYYGKDNIGRVMVYRLAEGASWMLSGRYFYWDFETKKWMVGSGSEQQIGSCSMGADGKWAYVPAVFFRITDAAATVDPITLEDADYELVGDGRYKNFSSDDPANDPAVLEKISIILKSKFEDINEGDVFEVTFKVYSGGVSEHTLKLEAYF